VRTQTHTRAPAPRLTPPPAGSETLVGPGARSNFTRAAANRSLPDIGANASAEEAEEVVEDQAIRVNNVVHSFRLQSTSFDKKGYLAYLKGKVNASLPRFGGFSRCAAEH
jgi:hypothetical protein